MKGTSRRENPRDPSSGTAEKERSPRLKKRRFYSDEKERLKPDKNKGLIRKKKEA